MGQRYLITKPEENMNAWWGIYDSQDEAKTELVAISVDVPQSNRIIELVCDEMNGRKG